MLQTDVVLPTRIASTYEDNVDGLNAALLAQYGVSLDEFATQYPGGGESAPSSSPANDVASSARAPTNRPTRHTNKLDDARTTLRVFFSSLAPPLAPLLPLTSVSDIKTSRGLIETRSSLMRTHCELAVRPAKRRRNHKGRCLV